MKKSAKIPKVSVIVPIYNVEKYLAKCLNSLINQTLKEIEIICVNDGSTDNSLKILENFEKNDSRIKVVSQQNMGLSGARNTGLNIATGEYIGFVDSDDWVDLEFFEKLYNVAKENSADISCAGFKRRGKFLSTTRISYKKVKVYEDINDKILAIGIPEHNYIWNKIYLNDKWNFKFQDGRYFEDMAISIKILHALKKMVTVPNVYYNYRRTPNSIVFQKSKKLEEDYKWAEAELYSFAKEKEITLPAIKKFDDKKTYKFLGINILKIYYHGNFKKYRLFGFIPIFHSCVK